MTLQQRVIEHITAILGERKPILCAVSGGIDSMVLLHVLKIAKWPVTVAHVNHQLRSESDADAAFVKETADQWGLSFIERSVNVNACVSATGWSTEMAAHQLRRDALLVMAETHDCEVICTAHHRDDQVETILMRIHRGTGRDGLAGLNPWNPPFLKPMLNISKQEIQVYQESNAIPFREDSSNHDLSIERNVWRHEILPRIRERLDERFETHLLQTASDLSWSPRDRKVLQTISRSFHQSDNRIDIPINSLNQQTDAAVKYLVESASELLTGSRRRLNRDEFTRLLNLIDADSGTQLRIGEAMICTREFDCLSLCGTRHTELEAVEIRALNQDISYGTVRVRLDAVETAELNPDPDIEFIDLDQVKLPITIRPYQSDDRIVPLGMSHRQSVNRLLKSAGVSPSDRRRVPILVSGDTIIWVAGYRLSDTVKITETSTRIGKLQLSKQSSNQS